MKKQVFSLLFFLLILSSPALIYDVADSMEMQPDDTLHSNTVSAEYVPPPGEEPPEEPCPPENLGCPGNGKNGLND